MKLTPIRQFTLSASLALLALSGIAGVAAAADNPTASLTTMSEGAMSKVGYYMPQRLALTADKPAGVSKEPTYAGKPMYGTLHFGAAAHNAVPVVFDMTDDAGKATLYVDANRTGDLTSQAIVLERQARKLKDQTGKEFEDIIFNGTVTATPALESGAKAGTMNLSFYTWSPDSLKKRNLPAGTLFYYRDYGQSGEIKLGSKTYALMLLDEKAMGRYDVVTHGDKEVPPVTLLIDRDGDGKFNPKYERFDAGKPFNIGGKSYEVDKIAADGSKITLKPAATQVAEIPIPVNLSSGHAALAFTQKNMSGKTIHFPTDYKGKVVLLDFWATWCGPCVGEIPNIVKTYDKYHAKGFEILGISLDQANQEAKVKAFLAEHKMPWEQVYDGKFWGAEVAQMYSIDSIPHAYLIDGSTGKIIAEGESIRGGGLETAVGKALSTVKVSSRK